MIAAVTLNCTVARAEPAHSLWVPTDPVGLYTLVLAVFTAVLALVSIFQGFILIRSDKTARISAEAAKRSADAAVAAESGRFSIVIEDTNFDYMFDRILPDVIPPIPQDGRNSKFEKRPPTGTRRGLREQSSQGASSAKYRDLSPQPAISERVGDRFRRRENLRKVGRRVIEASVRSTEIDMGGAAELLAKTVKHSADTTNLGRAAKITTPRTVQDPVRARWRAD